MATTLDGLRDAFMAWGANITGRPAILENSTEGPKFRTPYFSLIINEYDAPTSQIATLDPDTGIETVEASTKLAVVLNLYGGNPMQDASLLGRSLYSSNRYKDLWLICGLANIDLIQDVSFLETGANKNRAIFTVNVYAVLSNTFTVDYFETLEGSVSSDKGSQDFSVDGITPPPVI